MLGSKRYNAYMKRTNSGIIVKTVDSITGVESLIKFFSNSNKLSGETVASGTSKEHDKPVISLIPNEDNPSKNRKKKYYLPKRRTITKLNHLRPYLKELKQNVPDFDVYEDSSSSVDFQNSNLIFVANSKCARDGVFNLNIPGKLGNVAYHGVLDKNGYVRFKAKSVIKPFTIIVGDYVINVNICHNLTSGTANSNKSKNEDDINMTNCSGGNIKHESNEGNTEIDNREIDNDSKNNDKMSSLNRDKGIEDNEEAGVKPDPLCNNTRLGNNNETEETNHYTNMNEKLEVSEFSNSDSEIGQNSCYTESIVTREQLEPNIEENHCKENNETKLSPSVKLSLCEHNSLIDKNSETVFETKDHHPYIHNNRSQQNLKSNEKSKTSRNSLPIRESLSSVSSNSFTFPNDSKCSNINKSCFSSHSVISGSDTYSFLEHNELEVQPIQKFNSAHITGVSTDSSSHRKCSSVSMVEIKRKLNEATASLHELSSVIESIENLSKNSVSGESVGINHIRMSCDDIDKITRVSSDVTNSSSLSTATKLRRCESHSLNGVSANKYYSEENQETKNKSNLHQEGNCENVSVKQKKSTNAIEILDDQPNFQGLRKIRSLVNLSEAKKPFNDSELRVGETLKASSTRTFKTKYIADNSQPQRIERAKELPCESKLSYTIVRSEIQTPQKITDGKTTDLPGERNDKTLTRCNEEHDCQNLRQESLTFDPRVNSYSSNSIKTIYVKSDGTSSKNMTAPVQHSLMKVFNRNKEGKCVKTNDVSLTNVNNSSKGNVSKSSFSCLIKQKVPKLKMQFWNIGKATNKKESNNNVQHSDNIPETE